MARRYRVEYIKDGPTKIGPTDWSDTLDCTTKAAAKESLKKHGGDCVRIIDDVDGISGAEVWSWRLKAPA
jgi:hypothetical protein